MDLKDALNDLAVIRVTIGTLEVFPDDADAQAEMGNIICGARRDLRRRLTQMRDAVRAGQAAFLRSGLEEFKAKALHLMENGALRRRIDSFMTTNDFTYVAETEAAMEGDSEPDRIYRFELSPGHAAEKIRGLEAREFIARLFDDVLDAVQDDANYREEETFVRNICQKYFAILFIDYGMTDWMS
jgi:hypothetical protein